MRENLPTQLTPFIGREREIAAVCAVLQQPEVRLVTLTGTGGVGKTRLGLKIAAELLDEFTDGVFYVSLASLSDPGLVIPTIAETLGIREVGDRILLDLLKAYLHDRSMLLLLDNFEQVIAASVHVADLMAWREENYLALQAFSEEALTIFNELGDKEGIADTLLLLSETYFERDDYANTYLMVEQAMALFRELGDQWAIAYSLVELADVVFMQGDAITARKLAEESLSLSIELGYTRVIAYGLEHLAEISAAMGEPIRAARLWGTEEALRDGEIDSGSFLPNMPSIKRESHTRSMAAVRSRLGDEAFAIASAEGRAMTPAQALAAQGSVSPYTSTTAGQPPKQPAKARSSSPDELTEREMEVLRLVARGLTNEQVAEQLFISPRTVNSHLTSIYAKIGVSSRSGATRYAIERKLV